MLFTIALQAIHVSPTPRTGLTCKWFSLLLYCRCYFTGPYRHLKDVEGCNKHTHPSDGSSTGGVRASGSRPAIWPWTPACRLASGPGPWRADCTPGSRHHNKPPDPVRETPLDGVRALSAPAVSKKCGRRRRAWTCETASGARLRRTATAAKHRAQRQLWRSISTILRRT